MAEKYNASNIALEQILNFIKSGEIAIPEIAFPAPAPKCAAIWSIFINFPAHHKHLSASLHIDS